MTGAVSRRATRQDILTVSVPLFASRGYQGVSMRDIAAAVGVQAAALYYHFPDKQALYMAVMAYAFRDHLTAPTAALRGDAPPITRLRRFIAGMVDDLTGNPDLILLLQRARLEGDEARHRLLVKEIFAEPFLALMGLMQELAPDRDAHLLAVSVAGLVMFPLETTSMRRFSPGWRPEHEQPERLVEHVCGLVEAMLGVARP